MTSWTPHDLERIGAAEELQLATFKKDDVLVKPVTIWVVQVCVDGTYALYLYGKSIASNAGTFIAPHSDIAIHKGLNQTNVVAVVAQGSTLDLYVNHSQVACISDGTYTNGQIGVAADGSMSNSSTEVAFSNARVWTL